MIGGINASKIGNEIRVIRSNFEIMLSTNDINLINDVNALNNLLNRVNLRSKVYNKESEVIWNKLSRLSIVSGLTAATQMPLGFIKKSKKWKKIMLNLIDEVVLISLANDYKINKDELLYKILNMPDSLTTSLQRDIANNKDSELDAIIGAVISSGKQFNCTTSTLEEVYNIIKEEVKQMKKVIAIIGARSGSKGVKDKNIKEILGKPLMSLIIKTALASKKLIV